MVDNCNLLTERESFRVSYDHHVRINKLILVMVHTTFLRKKKD